MTGINKVKIKVHQDLILDYVHELFLDNDASDYIGSINHFLNPYLAHGLSKAKCIELRRLLKLMETLATLQKSNVVLRNVAATFVLFFCIVANSTAQVDMSLFNRDQIWLFEKAKHKDESHDGIILSKEGGITCFDDAFYSKRDYHSGIKAYRQDKAVLSFCSIWAGADVLSKANKTLLLVRSGYYWNITKLTNTEMVLTRGKKEEEGANESDVTTYYFKRYAKYPSKCLPLEETCNGSGDTENIKDKRYYMGIYGFNTEKCKDPYRD